MTASPNPALAGEAVTFTITVRGPGVLSVESAQFGDGTGTGANAGEVPCGQTPSIDVTHSWAHAYSAPGTYQFRDEIGAIGPPPACRPEQAEATASVAVSALAPEPLQTATANGAFLSPTTNIACNIDPAAPDPVRCATFSPPQLVTMDPTGGVTACRGRQCELGNPGAGTPVLPYGSATGSGPYLCVSATEGVTCTVSTGGGFLISRSGIQSLAG